MRALGISIHTGWAACVVVGGSLRQPEIVANVIIDVLPEAERFCFHAAAEMKREDAAAWIERMRTRALANARRAIASLLTLDVSACALVAKPGERPNLAAILASHARIHAAEASFYRDVFNDACSVPVHIVAPALLDAASVGKLSSPPWGRDQKLAALAAWHVLE
jgi:hypothetical protein